VCVCVCVCEDTCRGHGTPTSSLRANVLAQLLVREGLAKPRKPPKPRTAPPIPPAISNYY
jgi:hypothetical protein